MQLLAVGGTSFPVRGGHNSSTLMDVNAVAAQTTDICMGFSGPLAHSWLSAAEQTTSLNMDHTRSSHPPSCQAQRMTKAAVSSTDCICPHGSQASWQPWAAARTQT